MSNSLNNGFDKAFVSKYQDIRNKTLVSEAVTNHRLESNLKMGKTVSRFKLDLSGVRVRSEARYSDRTLDSISDSEEYITIDQEKYLGFPMHKNDKLQNGPLKAGEEAGRQMAIKATEWLDGFYLSKVRDAYDTFDAGDIGGSAGAACDLTTLANIPKITTLAPAKLKTNRISLTSGTLVVDPYAAAYIEQYLLSKDIDVAGSTFKNGYTGNVNKMQMYVSDNLTFSAEIDLATNPTANDTITIGGVTFKFVASPSAAGDVDLGSDAAGSLANVIAAINGGSGAGTAYVAVSAANRIVLDDVLRITASASGTKLVIVCVGAGRVAVSDALTASVNWAATKIHGYIGNRKQIDAVTQREVNLDIRPEPKQPVDNHFVDFLAGAKVFDDGKQNFLDFWIAA